MNRLKRKQDDRPKAFWGALISAGVGIANALINSSAQKKQRQLQANLEDYNNSIQEAQGMTNALNAGQDYQQNYLQQFKQQARLGTTRILGGRNIMITDGGNAKRIGNNTYLLRGGSHEDINETGQTGIGINVGGNEIEAEGGEVAQRKGNSLRIYSAQPILGGMSPAQAILRGYNKDAVFSQQQAFKKRNGLKDDGNKAQVGGYYGANYPSPLSLLSVLYDKTLGRFDDKNPNIQTGIAPTPSRSLNLKQVRNGLVTKSMLPTNRIYRITNMREVKDAKAVGQYREMPDNVTLPSLKVTTRRGLQFDFGKRYGNSHGGKAASMGEPWTHNISGGVNENRYVISTPSRHTTWSVGHGGRYSKPLPADAIKKGSGLWKKFDANGNTGISTKRMVVYKELGNGMYLRLPKSKYRLGGGLTSKDRGSSKHPYPSVSSKDFAGGNRSYPIPTKADAIDALRLAGLHGRSDVRGKVYSKYPELRKKADFGTWVRSNRNDNVLANFLYESGITDKTAWRSMLRDIHTFTGMGSDPYNDDQDEAVVTPGFGIPNPAQLLKNVQQANKLMQAVKASQVAQRTSYAAKQAKDFYRDLGINIPVGRNNLYNPTFRSYALARNIENSNKALQMSLHNTHLPKGIRLTPIDKSSIGRTAARIINPREAEIVRTGINIAQSARNMTSGANPFLYAERTPSQIRVGLNRTFGTAKQGVKNAGQKVKDFGNKVRNSNTYRTRTGFEERYNPNIGAYEQYNTYKLKPWVKATAGAAGTAGVIGLGIGLSNVKNKNENNKTQLDAKGQPISTYIARPQEPVKTQTRQVPSSIARKDTTKQVNKVVKRQIRTTPQYTGNTTRGNYQLHEGETKVINGVKYTRRGNTIINHKTNVGYIYDKNGNYTGQADYSKVGNFNQAFDAARAAGRNQFIYHAGKYNNYSTVKETNAKKEALNRRIGARRIAKRMGGLTNPPVGSRKKYLPGGIANPWDEYRFTDYPTPNTWNERYGITNIPNYGGTAPWQISNKYAVNAPYSISKYDLPITTVSAKKDTFNDEMSKRMKAGVQNLKDNSDSKTTVPYLGKQSSFKPTTQDYIGLGIDTLASLGIGLINSSAAGKTYLPERPAIIQASKLPTYYNVAPEVEEIKRQRDILNGEIANNTSSSVAALNRISRIRGTAAGEINKLYATKENEENKMLTQDALNQQQVAAENAKLQADYETNKANILNAATQAKANALSGTLSGLSQAWTNFASSVENRYDSRQNEIAAISSANSPSVVKNAISLGYNLSPEVLANLYKNSKNNELRNAILGRLSANERKRYGIE